MGYDKKSVVQYCYYEMISSYFNSYEVTNPIAETAILLHFREANADFQYACEDFAIYSIENELPSIIRGAELGKLDAKIKIVKESNIISIDAGSVKFDAVCGYDKGSPVITYKNVYVNTGKK